MKIISIVNGKGGVAKTTSAVNMAAVLAIHFSKKVLLVDLDKQSNATKYLNVYNPDIPSIADVLMYKAEARDVIQTTDIENLDLLPANYKDLEGINDKILLDVNRSRDYRLKELTELDYEYIIIDCPPSLDVLVNNALQISTHVLVPIKIDAFGLEGFDKIMDKISNIRDQFNSTLKLLGAFITLDEQHTRVNSQIKEILIEQLEEKFLSISIRKSIKAVESTFSNTPVVKLFPNESITKDYIDLTKEVLKYV